MLEIIFTPKWTDMLIKLKLQSYVENNIYSGMDRYVNKIKVTIICWK